MCRAESGSEKANGKADAADDDDGDAEALSTVDLAGVEAKVESRTEVWVRETLLGIIICFAQVPESIAFAYMAHVKAPVALHAAWEIGLVCGIFGGRPGLSPRRLCYSEPRDCWRLFRARHKCWF